MKVNAAWYSCGSHTYSLRTPNRADIPVPSRYDVLLCVNVVILVV